MVDRPEFQLAAHAQPESIDQQIERSLEPQIDSIPEPRDDGLLGELASGLHSLERSFDGVRWNRRLNFGERLDERNVAGHRQLRDGRESGNIDRTNVDGRGHGCGVYS
jgi:hypothetical protein